MGCCSVWSDMCGFNGKKVQLKKQIEKKEECRRQAELLPDQGLAGCVHAVTLLAQREGLRCDQWQDARGEGIICQDQGLAHVVLVLCFLVFLWGGPG